MIQQPLKVSPSVLGKFFFLDCERMLRYSVTPEDRREAEGVPLQQSISNPVTEAIVAGGHRWEEEVVRGRLKGKVILGPAGQNQLWQRILPYKRVLATLKKAPVGKYLYQSHLEPPQRFYDQYGIDCSRITFSPCRPDLLHLADDGDRLKLKVIDIKASESAKFSHWIQTAIYALILRNILDEHHIDSCLTDIENCYIWLYEQPEPQQYDISKIIGSLEQFLRQRLQQILLQPASSACWALSRKCEWCEYLDHCWAQAEQCRDLSLLPYFSVRAKQYLQNLATPITDLEQLGRFLENSQTIGILRNCGALLGSRQRLQAEVAALLSRSKNKKGQWRGGTPLCYQDCATSLPKSHHIGIVLTLQQDPMTGGIFAAGVHVHGGKEIHGHAAPWTIVAESLDQDSCRKVVRKFLARVWQIMQAVDEYNRQQDKWIQQKTLQCYVYDGYERELLDDLLANALQDSELARQALSMFFYFQAEQVADVEWHSNNEIPFPVIVLTEVMREVMALPVPVTYKLAATSVVLMPDKYVSVYREKSELSFPLSNKLRTDVLLEAWSADDNDAVELARGSVNEDLHRRLKSTFSVIAGMRDLIGNSLVAYPPRFFVAPDDDLASSYLSQLIFMTRYEEALQYLEMHASRSKSRDQRLESGNAIRIQLGAELTGGVWQATLAVESAHIFPDASGYADWLLSTDTAEGDREQMSFPDFWYREQRWVPRKHSLAIAAITDFYLQDGHKQLRLKIFPSSTFPEPTSGSHYLLHRRYVDFTSRRILSALHQLDRQPDSLFLRLLKQPHRALQSRQCPPQMRRKKDRQQFLAGCNFTASQSQAFERILGTSHQLIWGPPGTGKTYFLAMMIHALAALAAGQKQSLTVLLTAFTHAAIENCLRMVARYRPTDGALPVTVTKLGQWQGQDCPETIACARNWQPQPQCHQIIGCTIHKIVSKDSLPVDQLFDLVVIDEGSQLKVAEAAIAISRVDSVNGRLVIAGDDRQLGPIIKGRYASPDGKTPPLFTSIFECLHQADCDRQDYTSQLLECFRLNDSLCRFPAASLYGDQFRPANDAVAGRRIRLAPLSVAAEDNLAESEINPERAGSDSRENAAPASADDATPATSSRVRVLEVKRPRKVWFLDDGDSQAASVGDEKCDKPQGQPQMVADGRPERSLLAGDQCGQTPWLSWILDPDYPLVLLMLQDVPAVVENPVEAGIVAELTIALRRCLLHDGHPYRHDKYFWQQGLFIVSPHHIQIHAIVQKLQRRKHWHYPPFVDTVDKMQGQESECAIISYGVADIDYALQEGEFIYSLRRLNVAMTRARAKTIVCLPAPLLNPPLSAFAHTDFLDGLNFMVRLRDFVDQTGEKHEYPLPEAGARASLVAWRCS